MSKLYKYLPFDIKVIDEDDEIFKMEAIDKLGEVLCDFDNYDVDGDDERQQEGNWMRLNNPKPLLKSLKQIDKNCVLTWPAGTLIGSRDKLVKPIEEFVKILFNNGYALSEYVITDNSIKIKVIYVCPEGKECDRLNSFEFTIFNNSTRLHFLSPEFPIVLDFMDPPLNVEKAFDFLRAMHFAVGLEENEYQEIN